MVICLERGADLHMARLLPLPLTVSCLVKSRLVLPFWYRLSRVVPDKGPLNGGVCVTYLILLKVSFFWIFKVKQIRLTDEVAKSVTFHVRFSQDLTCQKSLKSVSFLTELFKRIKCGRFYGTQCRIQTEAHGCEQLAQGC